MLADDEEWSISRHYYAVLSVPCKHSVVKAIRVDLLCHNIDNYRITGCRGSSHNIDDSTRCGNCALPVRSIIIWEWTVDRGYKIFDIHHHAPQQHHLLTCYVLRVLFTSFLFPFSHLKWPKRWPMTNDKPISYFKTHFTVLPITLFLWLIANSFCKEMLPLCLLDQ
jgi:hypothetical protein